MRNTSIVLAIMCALLGGTVVAKHLLFSDAAELTSTYTQFASVEQVTLQKVNAERAARGLPPLVVNAKLTTLARNHAWNMIDLGYFSHLAFAERARKAHRSLFAENLYTRSDPHVSGSVIVSAWMHSPEHKKILLLKGTRRGGIGIAVGTYRGHPNVAMVVGDFSS